MIDPVKRLTLAAAVLALSATPIRHQYTRSANGFRLGAWLRAERKRRRREIRASQRRNRR
jgi:hypothetical protein